MEGQEAADLRVKHDPEKCESALPRDKREAFARRSCSMRRQKVRWRFSRRAFSRRRGTTPIGVKVKTASSCWL